MSSTSLGITPEPAESLAIPALDEPDAIRRGRSVLRDILGLVAGRAEDEAKVAQARISNDTKADTEYEKARAVLVEKYQRLGREAVSADEKKRRGIVDAALADAAKANAEFSGSSRRIAKEFDVLREAAKSDHFREKAAAEAACAGSLRKATKDHHDEVSPIQHASQSADETRERLTTLATTYAKLGITPEPPAPARESYARYGDPLAEVVTRHSRMEAPLKLLEGLIFPKIVTGLGKLWLYLLPILIAGGLALWLELGAIGLVAAIVVGGAIGGILHTWLIKLSKAQLARDFSPLMQSLANIDDLISHCRALADERLKKANEQAIARREEEFKQAKEKHAKTIAAGEARRDEQIRKISEAFSVRSVEVQTTQQRELREAIDAHDRRMAEIPAQSSASLGKLESQYQGVKQQIRERHDAAWDGMARRWREGIGQAADQLAAIRQEVDAYNPPWDDPAWKDRPSPSHIPPVLRFGTVTLDLASIPQGISADPRLMEGLPHAFEFPALRPFPSRANLLIEAPSEGRSAAVAVLQTSMFRLLTSLPPGKVRFTIVDPAGIGRSFGAFMHLADYDADLVNHQVWTENRQIEEKLAELAGQMEVVAQKYLRNEYATIDEYNRVAGEVAEPYRVLVVADFPGRFEEKVAARIAAIASGGVPCGVLTILAADPSRPMPLNFEMDDLRPHCALLRSEGGKLAWDDPDFGAYPLTLDPPMPADFATSQIQKVGAAAVTAKRVMVPFEYIAPPDDALWTRDSRAGIDIPLGKAGATKRQNLALGQGTSQHVLIAGRTGSGKSTLMHALITNLVLNYSPDDIELYLIDFKKGVEFKVYATHQLPHAAVVAIESEREFGISVLQRIDAELRLRADRFRDAGVQDINGFRNAKGTPPLPRILLVVDEFQEFFVEEDKLAQDAALLLDRLVRQGRAFGIHVLLGSQSLTGAFTLARSTIGQMAVRIALQCSEADSHLILSEQNPAARLLSRPGEAIYNDANGAPEGNNFFQVVWLSDERREAYLKQVAALAVERKPAISRKPIVFEGDAAAELSQNPAFNRLLDEPGWPETPRLSLAWLGDPVAIKEPTSAPFRRQGGSHLLIVGQQEEAAIGVIASALLSLAAQFATATDRATRSGALFYLLDGTPEGNPHAEALARVARSLPHGVAVGGWRDVPKLLAEVAAEYQRRKQSDGGDGPEIFLFLHDLPNFRDLRRKEDDYSFSKKEEPASPADHLDAILREGSRLGIHVVAWCDTSNNLNRYFTHQVLREFEMRVFFQMSANDSGHLLDSPVASKLGPNRALFVSEDQNRMEKFRPYGIPGDDLLGRIAARLGTR